MSKERSGYVFQNPKTGAWTARITFTDSHGKRQDIRRVAESEAKANKLLRNLINDLESKGESSFNAEKMIFSDLAEKYKAFKVQPASYVGDRKISGLRSSESVEHRINALLAYFGKMRIRSITPSIISTFKTERLKVKTRNGQQRTITAVNRELEILRAMMRFAKAEGWIDKTPFEMASETLISKADEMCAFGWPVHSRNSRLRLFTEGTRTSCRCRRAGPAGSQRQPDNP